MKYYRSIVYLLLSIGFIACESDDNTGEDSGTEAFLFQDGFETNNNALDELFPEDGSRWTNIVCARSDR